ncbi:GRIM-19 [Pseudohyphozyma bogoriensis]|nr:GRIM-19 [Pseudohyphozyma bogoriensis]
MAPVQYAQDLPPAGGFAPVRYQRNLPVKGPGGALIFAGVAAVCGFGFWRVGLGNLEKRELQREKVWSRIHLVPLLMAEADRDAYRREQAALEREKVIMKDVQGWQPGKKVYNTDRYTANSVFVI